MKKWYVTYLGDFEEHQIEMKTNGELPDDGVFSEEESFSMAKKRVIEYIKEDIEALKRRLKKARKLKKGDFK